MNQIVKWKSQRRFGIEFEFRNSSSSLEVLQRTVQSAGFQCRRINYEHTRNNGSEWCAKTDSSCGTELASGILKGWRELKLAAELLPKLEEAGFYYQDNCGMHVHVELADYNSEQAKVLGMIWLKIERFVMNGTPASRQDNTYCRTIERRTTHEEPNRHYSPDWVWNNVLGNRDAINFGNYRPGTDGYGSRGTVEFRFGEMTFDPEVIKNRVRFLIWLVEICKILPAPDNLNWYGPKQILKMFGLLQRPQSPIKLHFSPAVQSMRKWVLERLIAFSAPTFERDIELCQRMLEEINNEQQLLAGTEGEEL